MTADELTFWLGEAAEAILRAHVEREALRNPIEANDE
jgi:hypothetical protein